MTSGTLVGLILMLCELAVAFQDEYYRSIDQETFNYRTGDDPVDELIGHASN